jgi:hypothetical protein
MSRAALSPKLFVHDTATRVRGTTFASMPR